MVAKTVYISIFILGILISNNFPGVQANNGPSSEVNAKNTAEAINHDTTDVGVNDGRGQGNPYDRCGYYNFFCY